MTRNLITLLIHKLLKINEFLIQFEPWLRIAECWL